MERKRRQTSWKGEEEVEDKMKGEEAADRGSGRREIGREKEEKQYS